MPLDAITACGIKPENVRLPCGENNIKNMERVILASAALDANVRQPIERRLLTRRQTLPDICAPEEHTA